jgi:hypothetical protein
MLKPGPQVNPRGVELKRLLYCFFGIQVKVCFGGVERKWRDGKCKEKIKK